MRHLLSVVLSGIIIVVVVLVLLGTGIQGTISSMQNQHWFRIVSADISVAVQSINMQMVLSFGIVVLLTIGAATLWFSMRRKQSSLVYFLYLFFVTNVFELVPQWLWWALDRELVYGSIVFITRVYLFGSFVSVVSLLLLTMDKVEESSTTYRSFSLIIIIIIGLFASLIPIDIARIDIRIMTGISQVFLLSIAYAVLLLFCFFALLLQWKRRDIWLNILLALFVVSKGGLHILLGNELRLVFCGVFFISALLATVYTFQRVPRLPTQPVVNPTRISV